MFQQECSAISKHKTLARSLLFCCTPSFQLLLHRFDYFKVRTFGIVFIYKLIILRCFPRRETFLLHTMSGKMIRHIRICPLLPLSGKRWNSNRKIFAVQCSIVFVNLLFLLLLMQSQPQPPNCNGVLVDPELFLVPTDLWIYFFSLEFSCILIFHCILVLPVFFYYPITDDLLVRVLILINVFD